MNIFPLHALEISVTENDEKVKPALSALLMKVELGVTTTLSSQAVVWATPWPNSTGAPEFKLIFAARVEPSAMTPASAPMPRISFSGFLERGATDLSPPKFLKLIRQ